MFNFDLIKELHPYDLVQDINNTAGNANSTGGTSRDNVYNMSVLTGSRRYIYPEVLSCRTYNLSADVKKFGILLWKIISLDTPLCNIYRISHKRKVSRGYELLRIDTNWNVKVWALIRDS